MYHNTTRKLTRIIGNRSRKYLVFAASSLIAAVFAAANQAEAGLLLGTNATSGNFDASSGTRTVAFIPSQSGYGNGRITDVDICIEFAKADGENFVPPYPNGIPYHNETHFRLTSPGGTNVTLIAPSSFNAGGPKFDGTIWFDQAAPQSVNVNPNTPQAGTYRPTGPPAGGLNAFNGQLAAGTWTLFIQDTVGADSLRFRNFTLKVSTIPEPASLALIVVGVCGGGALMRRSRDRKSSII